MSDTIYKSYSDSLKDNSLEMLNKHLERQRELFLNPETPAGELGRLSNNMAIVTNHIKIWHIKEELRIAEAELDDMIRLLSN